MKYKIRCESCGERFILENIEAGHILNCPVCQEMIELQPLGTPPADDTADKATDPGIWPTLIPSKQIKPSPEPITPAEAPTATKGMDLLSEAYDTDVEFHRDLVRFIVPCRALFEVPTVVVMVFIFLIWPFLNMFGFFCCLEWMIQIALIGCICTFFMEIVTETAQGQDYLPYFGSISAAWENFWSDIVVPTVNFICAIMYCQIPAIVGAIILNLIAPPQEVPASSPTGVMDPNAVIISNGETILVWHPAADGILTALSIVGMFFLPMVILILAFDKIKLLLRPDMILQAIRTILKPYLLGWICILIGGGIFYLASLFFPEPQAEQYYFGNTWHIAAVIPLLIIDTLVFIYAMRVVGLLYRHYSHMLPWKLEPEKKHPLEEE
jgi:hypothetical protein